MSQLILSMQRKVIGGYVNAAEMLPKHDSQKILSITLEESWFEDIIHRSIVRAISALKKSGAEVCELNVTAFLERHGMPRNLAESEEINRIQSEYAITPKSFFDYITAIKQSKAMRVRV